MPGADLKGAKVTGADFNGADLNSVHLEWLSGREAAVNLDKARNLEAYLK